MVTERSFELLPMPANMQFMAAFGAKIPMTVTVSAPFLFTLVFCEAHIRAESRSTVWEWTLALGAHGNLLPLPSVHIPPPVEHKSSAMFCKIEEKFDFCSVFQKGRFKLLKTAACPPLKSSNIPEICSKKLKIGKEFLIS